MDDRGRGRAQSRVRLVAALVAVLGAVVLVRAVVVEPRGVASESMEPTLHDGSVVLVDKIGPRLRGVHRDDVVVFASPQDGRDAIKRVVAVGGQQVAIRDAELYVDGALVREPQVDRSRIDGLWFGPVTVPERTVFVLGDARSGSVDSRVYGSVPLGSIVGRVAVVW
ncbi:MAG TPA: signal peptidase I [Nocardioides sp.]|nr:signal peptidase I [Nocardioides sp.]